eukprot:gene7741-7940_t
MQAKPVQVTVREYVDSFFTKYKCRAYGKTLVLNAKGGAEVLMGMLNLVLSKGGRDELRIALHCFKDQLQAATNSPPAMRSHQVEELLVLMSALVDAAERLRQFSPVKENISAAVLEEVRWRLYRILAGDAFADEVDLRRRALDLPAVNNDSGLAHFTADGTLTAPAGALQQQQRRQALLSGPDTSCWEGLWHSLTAMSSRRMFPLLQCVRNAMSRLLRHVGPALLLLVVNFLKTSRANVDSSATAAAAGDTGPGTCAIIMQQGIYDEYRASTSGSSSSYYQALSALCTDTSSYTWDEYQREQNIERNQGTSSTSSNYRNVQAGFNV